MVFKFNNGNTGSGYDRVGDAQNRPADSGFYVCLWQGLFLWGTIFLLAHLRCLWINHKIKPWPAVVV